MGEMFPVDFVPNKISRTTQFFRGLLNSKKFRVQFEFP